MTDNPHIEAEASPQPASENDAAQFADDWSVEMWREVAAKNLECAAAERQLRLTAETEATARIATLGAENARLREALEQTVAFISVMIGRGADAVIPETIATTLGVPIKIGAIMRAARAALGDGK